MLRKLLGHMRQNGVAYLALFIALGGTTAYAANTIRSADIVDGEVKSADVANQDLTGGDIKDGSISSFDVASLVGDDVVDNTLTSADIQNFSLGNGDFLDQSVDARVVTNNSLLSSDLSTSSVGSDEVTDDSLTSVDIKDGSIGAADLSGAVAGATPFVGRGHLTCNPSCFAFNFRPQGFTNNAEPGALEDRPFRSPPGGLKVSNWAATLSTTVPAGQAFNMWLIQFSTSNVYLTCSISPGASSCNSAGTATIPAGDLFWVVINTSYSVPSNPYLDFSFRAQPAS